MMFLKRKNGFTLFELIVTIAVIGIIAVLAVPSFKNLMASQEAKKNVQILNSVIQLAKSQSVTHRTNTVLCSSADGSSCQANQWATGYILFLDRNKNGAVDSGEKVIQSEETGLKYGTLTWVGSGSVAYLTFRKPNGLPIGSNGTFTYCSSVGSQNHYKVILNDMGLTRQERPSSC
ncbi:GspH/FimT family pseudopilin [Acinetobacter chinensis]|jgi:type IV fimbrial biogenesis protein FimT|uniref:GspH/FimT family pseudopilin n=1 Tax=Acinetobacter chinensis TaxID=2004650 RepID=UPI002934E0BD|nr:GspH/FimT family pseudopilin [Acinetobacter chinensis]WOE42220.1 GspH/FimT family pseudopilin [Acinetobacter chinensis]